MNTNRVFSSCFFHLQRELAFVAALLLCAGWLRAEDAPAEAVETPAIHATRADRNDEIFYRNKLEFSQEFGVLPVNIPFVFDVFVGDNYTQKPLHYTLAPIFPSLRWHMGKISGPRILRGNTDMTFTLAQTPILRGPETFYDAFLFGFRRNFVPRNWRTTPYFESRIGVGTIDAQEPVGKSYAQGQDTTFTLIVGFGARYNFNPKYSATLGVEYMHISNLYLSEPKYENNGINCYGPMIGFNMRLGKPRRRHGSPAPSMN